MIKVLFVCHGNICRSPLAEYYFRSLIQKHGLSARIQTASAATSTEEIGNPVHPGSRRILNRMGIDCSEKTARQIKKEDYTAYDYLIGMDEENIRNMKRFFHGDPEGKIRKLLSYCGSSRDVADPWYTGDFEATKLDVTAGCDALMHALLQEETK